MTEVALMSSLRLMFEIHWSDVNNFLLTVTIFLTRMHCKAFTAHILHFVRKIFFANILLMVYQVHITSVERHIIVTYPEDDVMSKTFGCPFITFSRHVLLAF